MTGSRQQTNGSDPRAIEAAALRVFEREGYRVSRAAEAAGSTTVMDGKDHRAIVRFLWGAPGHDWNESTLEDFQIQMQDLQASRGYLISNGFFSEGAKNAAPELGISLTDGPSLKQTMYDFAPPMEGLRREPEKPLPFEKYIPWFVGVSLGVVALLVVVLISIALAFGPAETGA